MTNSNNIVLPPEIESLVQERGQIWAAYDVAVQDGAAINSLGNALGMFGEATAIDNLTEDPNPPDELKATIVAFRAEKTILEQLEAKIRDTEAKLESLRSEISTQYIVVGVGAVIVIGILVFWIMGMM